MKKIAKKAWDDISNDSFLGTSAYLEERQVLDDYFSSSPIDEAFDYTNDLETALKEIIQIQPLDAFGPMSARMRRIAREVLK